MNLKIYEKDGIIPRILGPYVTKRGQKFVILKYGIGRKKQITKSYQRFLKEIELNNIINFDELVINEDGILKIISKKEYYYDIHNINNFFEKI